MCGRGHEKNNKGRHRRASRDCHRRARRHCHRQVDSALGRDGTKKTLRGPSRPVMARQASWRLRPARLPSPRPLRVQDSASRSTAHVCPKVVRKVAPAALLPTLFFLPATAANRPCTSMSLRRGLLVGRGWCPRHRAAQSWGWRPGRHAGAAGAPGVDRPRGLMCGLVDFLGHGRFLAGRFLCSGRGPRQRNLGSKCLGTAKGGARGSGRAGRRGGCPSSANAPIPLKATFITILGARRPG